MGSRVLGGGDTNKGFAGVINRRFEAVRRLYTKALSWTLRDRPAVFALWAFVIVLAVPLYLFSQKELAPIEDQGVVFGYIQAAANSTLDQTKLFTAKVYEVYKSFPESDSIFQIISPTQGFRGMVTNPCTQRPN